MAQSLSGTDWYMEAFGLTVSFSLYGDLLGISEWAWREQAKCVVMGGCKTSVQKKTPEEEAEIAAAKAAEAQVNEDLNNFANPDDEVTPGWSPEDVVIEVEAEIEDEMNDDEPTDVELNF